MVPNPYKALVADVVKSILQPLYNDRSLDKASFKEIAQEATKNGLERLANERLNVLRARSLALSSTGHEHETVPEGGASLLGRWVLAGNESCTSTTGGYRVKVDDAHSRLADDCVAVVRGSTDECVSKWRGRHVAGAVHA